MVSSVPIAASCCLALSWLPNRISSAPRFGAVPAGIDAATGAMFRYPDTFEVPMSPGRGSPEGPLVGTGATALPYVAPTPLPSLPRRQDAAATMPTTTSSKPLPGTLPDNF